MSGTRILANQSGRLDWQTPQHDQYGQPSAGIFGMLPALVQSLGGRLDTSVELSTAELESADVVLLLHPDATLSADQQQRIWQYVRRGGALLVVPDAFRPGVWPGRIASGVTRTGSDSRARELGGS